LPPIPPAPNSHEAFFLQEMDFPLHPLPRHRPPSKRFFLLRPDRGDFPSLEEDFLPVKVLPFSWYCYLTRDHAEFPPTHPRTIMSSFPGAAAGRPPFLPFFLYYPYEMGGVLLFCLDPRRRSEPPFLRSDPRHDLFQWFSPLRDVSSYRSLRDRKWSGLLLASRRTKNANFSSYTLLRTS